MSHSTGSSDDDEYPFGTQNYYVECMIVTKNKKFEKHKEANTHKCHGENVSWVRGCKLYKYYAEQFQYTFGTLRFSLNYFKPGNHVSFFYMMSLQEDI